MPDAPAARIRSSRIRAGVGLGIVVGALLVGAGAAVPAAAAVQAAPAVRALSAAVPAAAVPATAAEPVFAEGDCVIYRVADAGPGGAQCAGVDLSGTRFGEGDFRTADLQGASFVDGDVQGAVFTGANVTGADFSGTRIVGADFSGSSILPATIEATADATGSAPIDFTANLPTGLTLQGCSIVGTPVESGQTFPVGTSNILCTLSTSFEGTAQAVMAVNVVASPEAPPTQEPLFTPVPEGSGTGGDEPNTLMIGGFIGGGLLVALGIAAFVFSNRRNRAS